MLRSMLVTELQDLIQMRKTFKKSSLVAAMLATGLISTATIAAGPPNIVVIWGDDIGQSNISAYSNGLVGYRTPNIDSIAREGMLFTDYYAEQSSTAGRSSSLLARLWCALACPKLVCLVRSLVCKVRT